ncbi:MAG: hypothetical protein B7X10_05010 [Burkholderiales bacterium 21-58-4]|nr:MAG: hypothetical protein B7X10_05010 [Burkholderiales bacterium 21-58-4]
MKRQKGFTLIELVVVIVILGILSAIALPRFISLDTDARMAKMNGALGAVKSAAALAHANAMVKGDTATTTMEGVAIDLVSGYPAATASGIGAAAGGLSDYTVVYAPPTATVTPDASHPSCSFVYTQASGPAAASYTSNISSGNC